MVRKRATWSSIDLAQFKQLISGPHETADLLSKQAADALAGQGFVDVNSRGVYSLNEYGEGIAAILEEMEGDT